MSKVKLVPYVDPKAPRMGLEKEGKLMLDGVYHEATMVCKTEGGRLRYVNGIDYLDPVTERLPKEEKEAKKAEIKKLLIHYEGLVGGVVIDEDDKDWYNKITKLKPDNIDFWESPEMKIELDNYERVLDDTNPFSALKILAIRAGGYEDISDSLEHVKKSNPKKNYYLDVEEETMASKTEVKKLRNRAGGKLQTLYDKNNTKLFYITKLIATTPTQIKRSTPQDVLYDICDKFISGDLYDSKKRLRAQEFLNLEAKDLGTLKIEAVLNDAIKGYKLISMKSDGMIYHMETGAAMGKNMAQIVEYVKNPLNQDVWDNLQQEVEEYWKM